MTSRRAAACISAICALALMTGCGGSGSGSGGGTGTGTGGFPMRGGGTTSSAPPAAMTARILFQSSSGEQCCVAVDASLIPDGALLVLDNLPSGPATVSVSFFPGDFAPAVEGIDQTCVTNPTNLGMPCDTTQVASPSFQTQPQTVNIVPGIQTNLGTLIINALPFILDFQPLNGETVDEPVQLDFTIVDAATGIDPNSVALQVTLQVPDTPGGATFHPITKRLPLMLNACDDSGPEKCSSSGDLDLVGFHANTPPTMLVSGPVDVHILGTNEGEPTEDVDFHYGFEVSP